MEISFLVRFFLAILIFIGYNECLASEICISRASLPLSVKTIAFVL